MRRRRKERKKIQGEGSSTRPLSPTPRKVTAKAGREEGEEDIATITTRPLKMTEIQGSRKDFSQYPNEPTVAWFLGPWDINREALLKMDLEPLTTTFWV